MKQLQGLENEKDCEVFIIVQLLLIEFMEVFKGIVKSLCIFFDLFYFK